MMYGYGTGAWWMMLMPVVWIALIALIALLALIVWAVVRVAQPRHHGGQAPSGRQTPQEILDRRYAAGEIDDDAYLRARGNLSGHTGGGST